MNNQVKISKPQLAVFHACVYNLLTFKNIFNTSVNGCKSRLRYLTKSV